MESSAGQPDVERLPAAFDEQTVLAKAGSVLSETAQLSSSTPAPGSAFLSPSAPPNGSSTNEATAILQAASTSNKTLEEILTQGGSTTGQAHVHQVLTETTAVGLEQVLAIGGDVQKTGGEDINVEGEPPAKRLKLDSASSSEETHKDGSELTSNKPPDLLHVPEDQSQIVGMVSADKGSLLSQRTLSQSSSLSDPTTPDASTLSPDIQTTLAQLNTSNLDIATRRNILLGRTKNKYICDVCGRECPSKHKLKRHLSTHSEERPFSCQICGKSFKWTEYLQKHMRQQHHGGAEGGSPSQASTAGTPSTKSPILSSPSSSLRQITTSTTASSIKPLPSPAIKSLPSITATIKASLTATLLKSDLGTSQKSTVDSGITVNMDDVLNTPASIKQSDSGTPKPTKQNASVGVNMDEEEGLTEGGGAAMNASHLTPLGMNQTVSVGDTQLIVPTTTRLGGEDSIGGGQIDQLGTIGVSGGQVDVTGGGGGGVGGGEGGIGMQQMQVARGGASANPPHHSIAMDSSGMCYATASMSQPLTTFVNGQQQQQQQQQQQMIPGAGAMIQGYSDGSMQASPHIAQQQGNPLQQQQYTQEMLQQSLTVTSPIGELNNSNSIPVSGHYSIPGDQPQQQQVQTMQVYTDQQMTTSHSMSELVPNSMSVDGLHSMTSPDLVQGSQQLTSMPVVQQQSNTDTVMMQDMSHMTQYTNYSMQDPMNASTMYATDSGTTQIQQTTVVPPPQSLNTQYPQQVASMGLAGGLGDSNIISQSVAQDSNVYASSVASYDMGIQSQEVGGMVNYSTSQQNMMVQTQSDMMGGFGVMHANGLLQTTQQDMTAGVGVMDAAMYGGGAAAGNTGGNNSGGMGGVGGGGGGGVQGTMMSDSQQQQLQQQADNYISQQLKKHMLQSAAQQAQQQMQSTAHDGSHVTQIQDHMTTQQQQQESLQQQFQTSGSSSGGGGDAQAVEGAKTATTETATSRPKVIIVHEEDPTVERFPVVHKSKKLTIETGVQCELGPETIKSLIEEEKALESSKDDNTNLQEEEEEDDGCPSDVEEGPHDKTVQKYPCELDNCEKAYIHRKDLIRHMKIRHGRSPVKLEPVTVEAREKPFACTVGHCGRSYYHLKDLRRHQRVCHKANLETRQKSVLKGNVEVDEDCKTQLRYPCDFPNCLRSYVHKKDLVRHKRLYHKDTAVKPTIPIPVRYTESELKRIKQEVKMEIDKSIEKIRLDSTGSTVSNTTASGGEDPPNSALLAEPEAELSSITPPNSEQSAVNISLPVPTSTGSGGNNGTQLVLYIDPSTTSTSSTTTAPQQTSTALFTGSSPCILPTSDALAMQNLSKAILSSMAASLPQGQTQQLDLTTASLARMASGEQVDPALISSEVASILGVLEQTHLRQQQLIQQQQQQQQQMNDSTSEQQQALANLLPDVLNVAPFTSEVPTTTATPTATAVNESAPGNSEADSVIESLKSEISLSGAGGSGEIAKSATTNVSADLHQLFTAHNSSEEPASEMSIAASEMTAASVS